MKYLCISRNKAPVSTDVYIYCIKLITIYKKINKIYIFVYLGALCNLTNVYQRNLTKRLLFSPRNDKNNILYKNSCKILYIVV